MATQKKTAIAKKENTAMAEVPDFLKEAVGSNAGQEAVGVDDIAIPRISLVQALSPVRDKKDDAYIEGIDEGDIYNTLTEENYGTDVTLIPVLYRKEFQVWESKRKAGSSGFHGSFESREIAQKELEREEVERELEGQLEVFDVPTFFVLVVGENDTEEAVVSFPRTKAKVAKKWNSLIRLANMASYAKQYSLVSVGDESEKGKFSNFAIKAGGFVTSEQYEAAKNLYDSIKAGTVKVAPEAESANAASDEEDAPNVDF